MAGPTMVVDKGYLVATTTAPQFTLVKGVSAQSQQCTPVTAATDKPIGVIQQTVATADLLKQVADVRLLGITKCVAGAAVAIMDSLRPDTSARAVTTTTAGQQTFGLALSAAAAAGDIIDVLLTPNGQVGA